MGVIRCGILGRLKGKIGNVQGSVKYSKNHLSKLKSAVEDKSRITNQVQNVRFKTINEYLNVYESQLKEALELLGLDNTDIKQRMLRGQNIRDFENVGIAWQNGCLLDGNDFILPMNQVEYQTGTQRLMIRWQKDVDKRMLPSDGELRGVFVRDVGSSPRFSTRALPNVAPRVYYSGYSTVGSGRVTGVARLYSFELGFIGPTYFVSCIF